LALEQWKKNLYAIFVAQSASALGLGIGPLIGGVIASTLGLRTVFAVASGLFVLIGLAFARFFHDISLKPETQSVETDAVNSQ
jgi:MFS family permease